MSNDLQRTICLLAFNSKFSEKTNFPGTMRISFFERRLNHFRNSPRPEVSCNSYLSTNLVNRRERISNWKSDNIGPLPLPPRSRNPCRDRRTREDFIPGERNGIHSADFTWIFFSLFSFLFFFLFKRINRSGSTQSAEVINGMRHLIFKCRQFLDVGTNFWIVSLLGSTYIPNFSACPQTLSDAPWAFSTLLYVTVRYAHLKIIEYNFNMLVIHDRASITLY